MSLAPAPERRGGSGLLPQHAPRGDRFGMIDHTKTTLERAFEIARVGDCRTITDIRRQLRDEGYAVQQIDGRALGKQLMGIARKSREDANRT